MSHAMSLSPAAQHNKALLYDQPTHTNAKAMNLTPFDPHTVQHKQTHTQQGTPPFHLARARVQLHACLCCELSVIPLKE